MGHFTRRARLPLSAMANKASKWGRSILYLSFSTSQGGKTSGGRAAMMCRRRGNGATSGHGLGRGLDAFIVAYECHIFSSSSGRIAGFFDVHRVITFQTDVSGCSRIDKECVQFPHSISLLVDNRLCGEHTPQTGTPGRSQVARIAPCSAPPAVGHASSRSHIYRKD